MELSDNFLISKSALQKQKRAIKNYINLDTNIQIKLDFKNPESSKHFMEKGYDDQREMSYYKVFFNEELDWKITVIGHWSLVIQVQDIDLYRISDLMTNDLGTRD